MSELDHYDYHLPKELIELRLIHRVRHRFPPEVGRPLEIHQSVRFMASIGLQHPTDELHGREEAVDRLLNTGSSRALT